MSTRSFERCGQLVEDVVIFLFPVDSAVSFPSAATAQAPTRQKSHRAISIWGSALAPPVLKAQSALASTAASPLGQNEILHTKHRMQSMIFFSRWGFIIVIFLEAAAFAGSAIAFNCDNATLGVDYVICASPQLMDAEANLEEAYRAARASNGDDVKMAQREWVRSYGPACGLLARGQPSSAEALRARDCVLNSMNKRTAYLQSLVGGADLPSKQEQPTPPPLSGVPSSSTMTSSTLAKNESEEQLASDILSASDAIHLRCVGQNDTNFVTISESYKGVVSQNKDAAKPDLFQDGHVWSSEGYTYVEHVVFRENAILFEMNDGHKAYAYGEINRTTLVMKMTISMFSETFECEVMSGKKRI